MTKSHWKKILQDLKTIRSTNKFRTEIIYYSNPIPYYRDEGKKIEKVNVDEMYIRFQNREYLTHADVTDMTPSQIRAKFFTTLNIFDINKIGFKI